jgi:hypothetical protein
MSITNWMAWEGGVDLVAVTDPSLEQPNIIVHIARIVHTPVVMGFVSEDSKVGAYFGPKIFAGTPFEQAPSLQAKISVTTSAVSATSRIEVAGYVFEIEMSDLDQQHIISREPGGFTPFTQQGIEAKPGKVTMKVDGEPVTIYIPEVGITGGPGAVVAPAGVYAR